LNLSRSFQTINDIPPQQLLARVIFEAKKRSLPRLPLSFRESITLGKNRDVPSLRPDYLSSLEIPNTDLTSIESANIYPFTFLNETRVLKLPIVWNSSEYARLWQFNLHYFDWIRDILSTAYQDGSIGVESLGKIDRVTEDWLNSNPIYHFDGWHPYTTSLRIVNWVYALRAIPQLAKPELIESLWTQINYLYQNKEYFAGGNHLLENLRALIIGGLNFQSDRASQIVAKTVEELSAQLDIQILADGGHYELSPMYHLIMLTLVGESVAALQSANWQVPRPILQHLEKMLEFALKIRLNNGDYPLWNDAAYKISYPLDEVASFVSQLLGKTTNDRTDTLHDRLLKSAGAATSEIIPPLNNFQSSKLSASGYYILRSQHGIELAFDRAAPCPKELPPHAHADCLTVDLYYQGQAIIVDTGTSEYAPGNIRNYERSTLAHNTIEIADCNQSEIWGQFRVGRKAQPINVCCGNEGGWEWVSAAHDGYRQPPLQATHHRWVGLNNQSIVIFDRLSTAQDTTYISNFHFAPGLELIPEDLANHKYKCQLENDLVYIQILGVNDRDQVTWYSADTSQSWYAPEFGKRLARGKLEYQGYLPLTGKVLCLIISFNQQIVANLKLESALASLMLNDLAICQWNLDNVNVTANIF
jgi:uncharacterized heparinase superfamily protein